MKFIHAVIRKLRPRARHPDDVRDEFPLTRRPHIEKFGFVFAKHGRDDMPCIADNIDPGQCYLVSERQMVLLLSCLAAGSEGIGLPKPPTDLGSWLEGFVRSSKSQSCSGQFHGWDLRLMRSKPQPRRRHQAQQSHARRNFRLRSVGFRGLLGCTCNPSGSSPVVCGDYRMDDSGRGRESSAMTGGAS